MFEKLNKALQLTIVMTSIVIILGAYTRLKDAGLGCPDWPGCYGNILAPTVNDTFSQSAATKAWIEMIHRYVAGALGILILYIAIQAIRLRTVKPKLWILTTCVLLLVIYQALLGMWTVTLKLNPLVVMGHLLGGFTILGLLWWIYLQLRTSERQGTQLESLANIRTLKYLSIICTVTLISQIALGGWTSANYAALVCADFPSCQGHLWPHMDWHNAFALPGLPLENNARVTIQMAHRIGAAITTILLSLLSFMLLGSRNKTYKKLGYLLIVLLGMQISLGITNVLAGLPIIISLGHSVVAFLLLLCLISILFNLYDKSHYNQ